MLETEFFPPLAAIVARHGRCFFLLLLLLGACHLASAQAGAITGDFSGTLTQPGGPVVDTFGYSMLLFEDANGNVTGSSYSTVPGESYFAVESLTGTVANGVFTFQETSITSQAAPPGSFWCLKSGQLSLSADNQTLSGSWTGSGCVSGDISIQLSGLQFVPVTPCRIADTRNADGPFGGPELDGGETREFDIPQSGCSIPGYAAAYSLNVTVVPDGNLGHLSLWPSGQQQPTVSTLNSDGRVKANAAIAAAGDNGGVDIYVSDPSDVVLDINGYFIPANAGSALAFYPVSPCRVADTRNDQGPLGGPLLYGGQSRDFPVLSSDCSIPSSAQAYSLNVTAVPAEPLAYLTMWPAGEDEPLVSTLNASTGATVANAAIVPAGDGGDISVFAYNDTDLVLDINGYFAPPATGGLALYITNPCRVVDTRYDGFGAFNGVVSVAVEGSACAPPATAQTYVLNATVVPSGPLPYLSLWPDGEDQPIASTLNAGDGVITSNMAVVPTTNGSIDAYAYSDTQLILDLSSYFAP